MSAYVFVSQTCAPCNKMKLTFETLKEEFPSLQWTIVDMQNDPEFISKKYNVMYVPTIIVDSKNGIEGHSGTEVAPYYRILRNAIL